MAYNPTDNVAEILTRDLGIIADEVTATDDTQLWLAMPGVTNSVGTLALHICGNLHHFIGSILGHDGYLRDREAEFSLRDIPKATLLEKIAATQATVIDTLVDFDPVKLQEPMPDTPPQHKGRTIGFFLIQLCCHTSRHLGQMNYLRRILTSGAEA